MSIENVRMEANQILMYLNEATITDSEARMLKDSEEIRDILFSLADIIKSRGSEGNAIEKLNAYATLQGVELKFSHEYKSNILIGEVLQ